MLSLPMNQHTSPLCFFLSFDFKRNRKLSGFSLISNQTNCFYSFYSYARQLAHAIHSKSEHKDNSMAKNSETHATDANSPSASFKRFAC